MHIMRVSSIHVWITIYLNSIFSPTIKAKGCKTSDCISQTSNCNKSPVPGGWRNHCDGILTGACTNLCGSSPVHGQWAAWGVYGPCDATCGGGVQTRTRTCTDPAPSNGGNTCSGSSTDTTNCNTNPCPVDGQWSTWGSYGACDVTCGGGFQTRTRTCSNPAPANGGASCSGVDTAYLACNSAPCPGTTTSALLTTETALTTLQSTSISVTDTSTSVSVTTTSTSVSVATTSTSVSVTTALTSTSSSISSQVLTTNSGDTTVLHNSATTTSVPSSSELQSITALPSSMSYTSQLFTTESTTETTLGLTNIQTGSPSASFSGCICVCTATNYTLEERIEQIKQILQINKSSLSSTRRKLISVRDDRTISKSIGYLGVLILSFIGICIVSLDISRLYSHFVEYRNRGKEYQEDDNGIEMNVYDVIDD